MNHVADHVEAMVPLKKGGNSRFVSNPILMGGEDLFRDGVSTAAAVLVNE